MKGILPLENRIQKTCYNQTLHDFILGVTFFFVIKLTMNCINKEDGEVIHTQSQKKI